MNDVERLMATDSIRQLASRYAVSMDARDVDALVSLYVDDVQVGRDHFGRDALRDDFDRQLRQVGVTILFVGNHVIDFDDADHARGIVYCKAEIQHAERWIQQAIRYDDGYERRDGRWYFVRRRHRLFYGIDLSDNPLELEPANWPINHTGKGTLPESLPSWRRFGAWTRSNEETRRNHRLRSGQRDLVSSSCVASCARRSAVIPRAPSR